MENHNNTHSTDGCVILNRGKVLFHNSGSGLSLPSADITLAGTPEFRFELEGRYYCCLSTERDMTALPSDYLFIPLREAYPRLSLQEYRAAAKALELLNWSASTRFCGSCGAELERNSEISKRCTKCGREFFPQLSPAIIVLVRRGNEALLVHARTFSRPFFGLVAGFVETGETLEECVAREVMEETSLHIKNISYAGSQSWPYPATLMLGFTADYESGELRFADGELTEGGFFTIDNLPPLATPPSIARRLIDDWVEQQKQV